MNAYDMLRRLSWGSLGNPNRCVTLGPSLGRDNKCFNKYNRKITMITDKGKLGTISVKLSLYLTKWTSIIKHLFLV